MRCALYLRVSTSDQTVENQRRELERIARERGWEITAYYADEGISGSKGVKDRPGLDKMLKEAGQKFDVIMAWAIDRLGRSLKDLLSTIESLESVGCNLYLHQQQIDTTTPMGKLIFQVTGAFAEFERSMIIERVKAGMDRARAQGKHLGRPATVPTQEIAELLALGFGKAETARMVGVHVSTVKRIDKLPHAPCYGL